MTQARPQQRQAKSSRLLRPHEGAPEASWVHSWVRVVAKKQRFGCEDDALSHFGWCGAASLFGRLALVVAGAGQSRNTAFLVTSGLADDDVLRLPIGLYALYYRTVTFLRFATTKENKYDVVSLLRLCAKSSVANHPAQRLLRYRIIGGATNLRPNLLAVLNAPRCRR